MPTPTNAQQRLGIGPPTDDLGLIVERDGTRVLVRTPRGGFEVTYKRSPVFPQLVLESEWSKSGVKDSPRLGTLSSTRLETS
jgi:hypothetical protein